MSIENSRARKSSLCLHGENRREKTEQSSRSFQRSGGVGGDGMLRRATGVSQEICTRETGVSTEGTTLETKKVLTARAEVGVLHSSVEMPVMDMERRRGSSLVAFSLKL